MPTLCILGAGSWGTALAIALQSRFEAIRLWTRGAGQAAALYQTRENSRYLPGFRLPQNVEVSCDLEQVLRGADIVLVVTPSSHLREVLRAARLFVSPSSAFVSASKGLEQDTHCRLSQVLQQELGQGGRPIAVLSGPTFAREVAAGEPAAMVIASEEPSFADQIQRALSTSTLRLYTSQDVIGVEFGAALKNVIAIGAGICQGLGLGSNSVAALISRGLAEISRLALAKGGQQRTLSGLAGLGDLVLTATGDLSRNRRVGIELGKGDRLDTILRRMTMVAEGVGTCRAAYQLSCQENVEMPIVREMYLVLYEGKDPRMAIRHLMDRPLTNE